MKVLVSSKEKWQLEQHLGVLNNPNESIAKRRLAKSKFDLIYNRAATRSYAFTKTQSRGKKLAQLNEGEH
ncbi:hypothetical protein [Pontibacillus sp. HMF3514]|uniref:hypothetical protein n=1 Tax=Pontibacillus sp. HMF3514 TaxID=2692425 RepID=UPI00131F9184|nr:hypothetical protein [Pontibacillus sp. HMF3514]QHE52655.1 hypothetical protein GS400_11705 [Pontibacillus sp. HMF3514]